MSEEGPRFNLTEKPSRFGINWQQVASPSSLLGKHEANLPWSLPVNLVITVATVATVLCVLLVLKPGFIMTKGVDKPRICPRKLLAWLVLTLVVVHFHEKMRYLYGLLLQPICTVVDKAWVGVFA